MRPQLSLSTEIQYLKGVGPKLAALLASRGIATVEDLLFTLPFRYEDRSSNCPIHQLIEGERATVVAQIQTLTWLKSRRGMQLLHMTVGDGTEQMRCVWYHAEYLRDRFQSGQNIALHGRVARENGRFALRQPEFEILAAGVGVQDSLKLGRVVPIYEAVGSLGSGRIRRLVHRALADLPRTLADPLPEMLRQRLNLPARREAFQQVHFPGTEVPLPQLQEARTPGHLRLILEELFSLQAGLELKRRRAKRQPAPSIQVDSSIRERLKLILPFHPTADQKIALREIAADMASGSPMRRLLQGDVGSGKTIVAFQAAVIAIENGFQTALMAPTQILAEQHYLYARQRLPGYRVQLVTAGRSMNFGRDSSRPQLVIGTHALLESGAHMPRLGLVVVDEQHRFGVLQRFHFMHKDRDSSTTAAHVLVMTATPIPRTLALALYGDLDTSLIRHSPPGSLPIRTRTVPEARSADVYEFVRRGVAGGRQAYFVYPVIEESETLNLKPALQMFHRLRTLFSEFRVGLLHGRLSADERNEVMRQFRAGRLQVLVATTVIEVGVDVPNATLMVIEHAERFGISQLHQLRGRVGRPQPETGSQNPLPSTNAYCFLIHADSPGEMAQRRLAAVTSYLDGFHLAEEDLKLRGPGELFGTRQSGLPAMRVAQPLRDQELIEIARTETHAFLDGASAQELRQLVRWIQERWQRKFGLVEVG